MHHSELKLEIKDRIRGILPRDGQIRIVCPSCGGGSSHERSMSVRHSDRGVGFYCFRASCGIRGYLDGSVTFGTGTPLKTTPTTANIVIEPLPDHAWDVLPVKDTSVAPSWAPQRQMVLYPVLSYWGTELGYVARHYKALNEWWSGPKAINLPHDPYSTTPYLHFPLLTREKFCGSLVVVEDWPSAEAVAKYTPSCALLGTNLSSYDVGYLLKIGVTHLIICLDNDALGKAAIMKRRMGLIFDKITVVFVDNDPKDMTDAELETVFSGYK